MTNQKKVELIVIPLNSFKHRIDEKDALLALFSTHQAVVKRIRRSRNWQMFGDYASLSVLSKEIERSSILKWQWVAKEITIKLATVEPPVPVPESPLEFLQLEPNLTLAELLYKSDCTAADARQAIDEFEMGLD